MQKHLCLFLILLIALISPAAPLPASIIEELVSMDSHEQKITTPPDPTQLNPQWWEYFEVEGEELKQRILTTNKTIQDILVTVPYDDRVAAQPIVNKINATLNALYQAKKNEAIPAKKLTPLLKTYTLDKQLEINKQIRKLTLDIQNEKDKLEQLSQRITKSDKTIDNMLVAYLSKPSIVKGLEVMNYKINLEFGKEKRLLSEKKLKELEAASKKLHDELAYSKEHLDLQGYDQETLENDITRAQQEVDRRQYELVAAEGNLLGAFNDMLNSSNNTYLLEQQVLQANINKAYAASKLSFNHFKFNTIMHLHDRYEDLQHELRDSLVTWRETIAKMKQQSIDWEKAALKEQDRIRQEYAFLVAQNEADSQQMRYNQSMRQGVLQILTTLELLDEEIINTELLMELLENHFKANSSFLYNCWVSVKWAVTLAWQKMMASMNFSLLKISGIPITLFILLKVVLIIALSFIISRFVRSSLGSLGASRPYISKSSLYSLGSLAHYFILLMGFIIALASIGLDFSNLLFIAGAVTFGISFGLQSIANNFFCGVRMLFEKKLKIGDDIELPSGHHGKVIEIHVQNTVVLTNDGQRIIVPNSDLISNTLINWTKQAQDFRRLHIPFAVGSDCDKEEVRRIAIEAAKNVPCALKGHSDYPEPQIWLRNFTSHSLEFTLVVWVNYKGEAHTDSKEADFLWEIETAMRKHNIPLPTLDLHHLLHHQTPHKA